MVTQQTGNRSAEALYALVEQAKAYPDTILMARGDPDLDTPPHVAEAVARSLVESEFAVPPPEGMPAFREAIAARLRRVNRLDYTEDEIIVTNGAQEAIFLAVNAALGPGDELIVPEPNYNTYGNALAFAGGTRVSVPTYEAEGFAVDPERVRAAITPRSRALLLVSPTNPTGSVIEPTRLRALAEIAIAHDLVVIADDIYDQFLYDGAVHTSPATLPGMRERTLTINSLSKAYAMCGWRAGWLAGPPALIAAARPLKAAMNGGTSVVAQYAGIAALTGSQQFVADFRAACVARRARVRAMLDRVGLPYGKPDGGQFVFFDISSLGRSSVEVSEQLVTEAHVVASAGAGFGASWDTFMRVTYLQPEPVLQEGLDRIERVLRKG